MIDELNDLQAKIFAANDEKGFHEEGNRLRQAYDRAVLDGDTDLAETLRSSLANYYYKRIGLLASEVVEAQEELRSGRAVTEEYTKIEIPQSLIAELGSVEQARNAYLATPGVYPKPEGVPSEIADVIIRALDLFEEIGISAADVIQRKLQYNATRGHMHGGRKF